MGRSAPLINWAGVVPKSAPCQIMHPLVLVGLGVGVGEGLGLGVGLGLGNQVAISTRGCIIWQGCRLDSPTFFFFLHTQNNVYVFKLLCD